MYGVEFLVYYAIQGHSLPSVEDWIMGRDSDFIRSLGQDSNLINYLNVLMAIGYDFNFKMTAERDIFFVTESSF